jgi:hypothetical protein
MIIFYDSGKNLKRSPTGTTEIVGWWCVTLAYDPADVFVRACHEDRLDR